LRREGGVLGATEQREGGLAKGECPPHYLSPGGITKESRRVISPKAGGEKSFYEKGNN